MSHDIVTTTATREGSMSSKPKAKEAARSKWIQVRADDDERSMLDSVIDHRKTTRGNRYTASDLVRDLIREEFRRSQRAAKE